MEKKNNLPERWYMKEPPQEVYDYLGKNYGSEIAKWKGNWIYIGYTGTSMHNGILGSGSLTNYSGPELTIDQFREMTTVSTDNYQIY